MTKRNLLTAPLLADRPSLTAWELGPDGYALLAEVQGEGVFEATTPFPLTFCPAALVQQ